MSETLPALVISLALAARFSRTPKNGGPLVLAGLVRLPSVTLTARVGLPLKDRPTFPLLRFCEIVRTGAGSLFLST